MKPNLSIYGHLTEESALLLQSGELDSADEAALEGHLCACAACRELYQRVAADLEETQSFVMDDGRARLRQALSSRSVRRPARVRQIAFTAASAVACAVALILAVDSVVEPLSAAQFIERAMAEEGSRTATRGAVSIRAGQTDCSAGLSERRQTAAESSACSGIRIALQKAHWDASDPLSVNSFRAWRSSLKGRTDKVSRRSERLVLRTSTSEGVLRAASLAVHAETFHPVSLRLEIEGVEPVDIEESTAPAVARNAVEPEPARTVERPSLPASPKSVAEDPAEQLNATEVEVWIRLHRLHADLGFETLVSRTRDEVEVFGLVADDTRAEQIRAELQSIRGVRLRVKTYTDFEPGDDGRFPAGEIGNSLPPLAKDWLKRTFAKAADRQAFVDQAVSKLRALMGLAATLDQLRPLALSTANGEFAKVQADIATGAESTLKELRDSMTALAGECGATTQPITLERARTVDSALIRLVVAARNTGDDQQIEMERMKTAMGCRSSLPPQR